MTAKVLARPAAANSLPKIVWTVKIEAKPAPLLDNAHRFAGAMEVAMTGVVCMGALLFGAGLLPIAVPACQALRVAVDGLYALTGLCGLGTMFGIARALVA